ERLDMPYVFAPNIGDLYGNAILSRFPMTDVKRVHFAVQPSVKHQPRGAVGVRVGDILIITTHLDDVADSSAIRQEQVRTIMREWDGAKVAIIAGDMNAEPGARECNGHHRKMQGQVVEPVVREEAHPADSRYIPLVDVIESEVDEHHRGPHEYDQQREPGNRESRCDEFSIGHFEPPIQGWSKLQRHSKAGS